MPICSFASLDCYFDVSDQLLAEMDFLLERLDSQLENRSLATFMLVKMFAICIFTISNTFTADNVAKSKILSDLRGDFLFCFDFFV